MVRNTYRLLCFCMAIGWLSLLGAMKRDHAQIENVYSQQDSSFAYLPIEVCDLIAQYLNFKDRETIEEGIERTKQKKMVPQTYQSMIRNNVLEFLKLATFFYANYRTIFFYANHRTIVSQMVLPGPPCGRNINKLHVLDIPTQKITECDLIAQFLQQHEGYYSAVNDFVLTKNGKVGVAFLIKWLERGGSEEYLFISDTGQKIKLIEHAGLNPCKWHIALNKQETHIIVHKPGAISPVEEAYTVIPFASGVDNEQKSKKTLNEYFRQHCICKHITT